MRLFVCCRGIDIIDGERIIDQFLSVSENNIAILQEPNHSVDWKSIVSKKMQEADFVLFILGIDTFHSPPMIWEYAEAKRLNKHICGFKLSHANQDSIIYCQGFQVFDNVNYCFKFLIKLYQEDRELKLEQYRMMFESTQKVTEQRLTVNNLFFTLTASIFSIGFIIGKALEFSTMGALGMIASTFLAFLVTLYWEKLIDSYGKLNTGKFKVIDNIEKKLRTNMFEEEWKTLIQEVKYESNTLTEKKIIKRFRLVIIITGLLDLFILIYTFYKPLTIENITALVLKFLFNSTSCNC